MKILESKSTKVVVSDPENENEIIKGATYLQMCAVCVNRSNINPQTGFPVGFSIEDMRARMKILEAIKSTNGSNLILEDAEAKKLQEYVKAFVWGKIDMEVIAFVDAVEGMKEYKKSGSK